MNKALRFAVIAFLIFNIAGCAGVQRKFTRKKKQTVKMPRIYQVKKYETKPTPELYKKHYVYWESFQSEMIKTLGQNHKKDKLCIEHILSNLSDMRNMLLPDKAAELDIHIARLAKVRDIVIKEELSKFNSNYIMMTLERESRYIKKGFVYKKVKNSMRTSYEEEPDTKADTAADVKAEPQVPQEVTDGQSRPAE